MLIMGLLKVSQKAVFLLVLGFIVIVIESKSTSIIQTLDGPVQGEILRTIEYGVEYSSFKGIPFAEPPVGRQRFKPPFKKSPWTDVLSAVKEGSKCTQRDFVHRYYTGSEDCLYLNVYTPHTELADNDTLILKPVMVWIYGGSFITGYGDSKLYGPDYLIQEDVIVVTFNYRVGPLGFLSLDNEGATGNAGLKDQTLALKWVKNNIINFGGDPEKITIFGESAGGVSVDFHVLSDLSRGLFERSISMSASPLCLWGFQKTEDAVKTAFELGTKLGVRTKNKDVLLKVLMATPAMDIMIKANEMSSVFPPFKPTIERTEIAKDEEKFITECSVNKYKAGNYFHNSHLMGFLNQESLAFGETASNILGMVNYASNTAKSVVSTPLHITEDVWTAVADGIGFVSETVAMEIINVTTDVLFKVGIDAKQRFLSKNNEHPVYYYNIVYDSDEYSRHKALLNITFKGPAHADDLAYVFYVSALKPPKDPEHPVNIIRKRIVRMWTNFAKYGNPTPLVNDPLINIIWPDSTASGQHLEIGSKLSVKPRPENKRMKDYAGLGTSPDINGCPRKRLQDRMQSIIKNPLNLFSNWS